MTPESNAAQPLEEPLSPDQSSEVPAAPDAGESTNPPEAAEASPAASTPDDTPAQEPEGGAEGSQDLEAEAPAPSAGDGSSPAETMTPEEKEEKDLAAFEKQEAHLTGELERLCWQLFRVKDEKREADRSFNAEIKNIEDSIEKILTRLDETRQTFAARNAPPPPGALPFEGEGGATAEPESATSEPENAQAEPEEEATEVPPLDPPEGAGAEEAWLKPCPSCQGKAVLPETGEECQACMGTGKTVPREQVEAQSPQTCPHCGDYVSAHFTANHASRLCVLCGCNAAITGALKEGPSDET